MIKESVNTNTSLGHKAPKTWDSVSDKRINTLAPYLRNEVAELINEAQRKIGVKYRVTHGLRTFKEQNDLFAKGRTKAGSIVTNARGGQSFHNYGLAFDIVPIVNGKAIWNQRHLFEEFAQLAKKRGWTWGGDFVSFKDYPHFQKSFGLTTTDLFNDVKATGLTYPRNIG